MYGKLFLLFLALGLILLGSTGKLGQIWTVLKGGAPNVIPSNAPKAGDIKNKTGKELDQGAGKEGAGAGGVLA